jgi:hypothetical protein
VHEAEREESRCARDELTDAERVAGCRHYFPHNWRSCMWCGEAADDE